MKPADVAKVAAERKGKAAQANKATASRAQAVVQAIRKKHGDASILRMGERVQQVEVIPSGSLALDAALGVGGWPRGRVIELYGPESSGKTTLSLHAIAECQKQGGVAGFIDAEHALSPTYAEAIGVDMGDLLVSQPDYGEQALDVLESLVCSGATLAVVDSVAALIPKVELDGEMSDQHIGVAARMMGKALRKLCGAAAKHGCTVLFINQLRMKIGVMFGSPETTTGGQALRYYASARVDVRRRQQIKDKADGDPVGNIHVAKVVKNKLAPPFRMAEFEILYGQGIDKVGELASIAIDAEVIEQAGAHYSFAGERICQGRFNLRKRLAEDPELAAAVLAAWHAAGAKILSRGEKDD